MALGLIEVFGYTTAIVVADNEVLDDVRALFKGL